MTSHHSSQDAMHAVLRDLAGLLCQDVQDQDDNDDTTTTLMIRGLPKRYDTDALLQELSARCGHKSYNVVYLPWDNRRDRNMGYAFVNFVNADAARTAWVNLGIGPWQCGSTAPVEIRVQPARVQGPHALIEFFATSPAIQEGYKHQPLFFRDGRQVNLCASLRSVVDKFGRNIALSQSDASRRDRGTRCIAIGDGLPSTTTRTGDRLSGLFAGPAGDELRGSGALISFQLRLEGDVTMAVASHLQDHLNLSSAGCESASSSLIALLAEATSASDTCGGVVGVTFMRPIRL
mmetsp:Transcript_88474/g.228126  ORF Transcript_88474/g.228126 Transcript_88474/m.228126 type:complete len:291 (-) Transcript_88474:253-1125(-)